MHGFTSILSASVLLAFSLPAYAGEAEFGITAEFMAVCDGSYGSAEEAGQRFIDASWSEAGAEFRDALAPNDFLKKVKKVRAYEVELDNGAQWLAATAEGRFGKTKVVYCGITAIDDDPDGYRQDFELATGLIETNGVTTEMERRSVYTNDSENIFVMREIRSPDASYFTYIFLSPIMAK